MSNDVTEHRLQCGASLEGLFEQVSMGAAKHLTSHQRGCRYCATALREAEWAWAPMRRLAAAPVEMPKGLVGTIMSKVRQLKDAGWFAVSPTPRGVTQISTVVVAAVARAATRRAIGVTDVRYGWSARADRVGTPQHGDDDPGPAPATVEVEIVTAYGDQISQIADAVRRNIIADVGSLAGVPVERIDVEVVDVAVTDRGADNE